ncbi:MAG: cytochrome-c peroxidase [Bryobacterales bacterium]|nr:cytochrome-c peroxidase [Bryobacterales bacterium]
MRKYQIFVSVGIIAVAIALGAFSCARQAAEPDVEIDPVRLAMFKPLPAFAPVAAGSVEERRISLGRMLYFEPRLSRNQQISCNTCHQLNRYGVDSEPTSPGHDGQRGTRNSPTVFNAGFHFVQFWDGRAKNLAEQAKGPILNPVEMAMPSEGHVVSVLKSIPAYPEEFRAAFPGEKDPLTYDNVAKAIGVFEERLVTPAPWDRFLRGDRNAIDNRAKAGFLEFTQAGCQACHAGALLGGNLYQKLGSVVPYPDQSDAGRFEFTKNEADRMFFKVPSLRNIEKTGPYYHNGQVATVEEAIRLMGKHQLGRELKAEQVGQIAHWLKSLTGEIPEEYTREPKLPDASVTMPKPGMGK